VRQHTGIRICDLVRFPHQTIGKDQQIVQMMFDDFFHEVNVQISVLMRQDVSESDHFAEFFG